MNERDLELERRTKSTIVGLLGTAGPIGINDALVGDSVPIRRLV